MNATAEHGTEPGNDKQGSGRCRSCGYALEGLAAGSACPECGWTEAVMLRVPNRVRCIKCGYQLAGLETAGVCPECGQQVADSLRGPLLEFAPPAYVRGLRAGARLVIASIIASLALPVVWFIGSILLPSRVSGLLYASVPWRELLMLLAQIMHSIGWWKLATPDPRIGWAMPGEKARRTAREGAIIAAGAAGIGLVLSVLTGVLPSVGAWGTVATAIFLLWLIGIGMIFFGGIFYLQALALRMPSLDLQRMAKMGMLLMLGLFCLPFVGILFVAGFYIWLMSRVADELTGIYKRMNAGQPPSPEAGVAGSV